MDIVDAISELCQLHDSIDNIDAALIHLLAERLQRTRAVDRLTAQHRVAWRDLGREASQVTRLRELAAVSKLDPDFAEAFHAFVVREVIRQHEAVPRGFFEDTSPQ